MATVPITIEVDAEAAKVYAAASPEEQQKMQILLSLRLSDLTLRHRRTYQEVAKEISERPAARGLTPEILDSILRDEEE